MGKVPDPLLKTPSLPRVSVTRQFRDRVYDAAARAEQSMAAYIRMALIEKMERDADRNRPGTGATIESFWPSDAAS
jgi:hypothetical protein